MRSPVDASHHPAKIVLALAAIFVAAAYFGPVSTASEAAAYQRPTPTMTPVPRPTTLPSITPTPTQTPAPVQTLAGLQTRISQRLFAPEIRRGRIGIKIVSLATGKVVFEADPDKYFMPASNMKNFTVATAMERLGPDFKFVTSVLANAPVDSAGAIRGPLTIKGRGDISVSNAFDPAFPREVNPYWGIDRLADTIIAAGVKRVDGDIIGDESYFQGFALPGTWEWDDLQSYYGTEISALSLNDNAVDISVMPGSAGNQCIARVSPLNQISRVVNRCMTTAAGTKRSLNVVKLLDQNVIEVTGTMPAGDAEYKDSVAFTHPAELFVAVLKERLQKKGVTVTGQARTLERADRPMTVPKNPPVLSEIARLESPPFSIIAQKTMKPSQNMYTETILWTLGEQIGRFPGTGGDSSQLGLNVVKSFLKEAGVADDGIVQYDGSGLSRHDLITPSAVVTLYTYMAKQSKYAQAWRDALSIGGVDGTLARRFVGTAAAGNIRGKTGTIDQVSALSGYMTTAGGEQIVLSIVVNGVPVPRMRTTLIDDIVVNLANFNGRID